MFARNFRCLAFISARKMWFWKESFMLSSLEFFFGQSGQKKKEKNKTKQKENHSTQYLFRIIKNKQRKKSTASVLQHISRLWCLIYTVCALWKKHRGILDKKGTFVFSLKKKMPVLSFQMTHLSYVIKHFSSSK